VVVAAIGLAAIGGSVGLGVAGKSKWNEAIDQGHCNASTGHCDPTGGTMHASALSLENAGTITFAAGAALVVGGALLYLLSPRHERGRRATIAPAISPSSVGVTLGATF
jgi:hypothetical protein